MKKLKSAMDLILGWICIIIFALMTVVGTYQIVTRYVFNSPSTVSEELLTYSFTWMALLAAALVFGKRDHMRMSFLADKVSGRGQQLLGILSELVIMGFASLILIYGGTAITRLTMTQITASLGISMGYVYLVVPLSGVLIIIYNIINIYLLCTEKDVSFIHDGEVKQ